MPQPIEGRWLGLDIPEHQPQRGFISTPNDGTSRHGRQASAMPVLVPSNVVSQSLQMRSAWDTVVEGEVSHRVLVIN
jgi:hypothetical protein